MKIETGLNPKYLKIAIWIVVAVVVCFIAQKAWKKFKEWRDRKKLEKALNAEVVTSELSYSEAEFEILANDFYGAMTDKSDGVRGINEEQLFGVFRKIKTKSDLLKLADKVGVREYDFAWWNAAKDGEYSFLEVMRGPALTDGDKDKIKKILAENGVKFVWSAE